MGSPGNKVNCKANAYASIPAIDNVCHFFSHFRLLFSRQQKLTQTLGNSEAMAHTHTHTLTQIFGGIEMYFCDSVTYFISTVASSSAVRILDREYQSALLSSYDK